ncbi:AGAP010316-PA, partial [Anopheles gambiae str. PEST]
MFHHGWIFRIRAKYHVLMFVAVSLLFARVACRNPKGSLMTRKRPVL